MATAQFAFERLLPSSEKVMLLNTLFRTCSYARAPLADRRLQFFEQIALVYIGRRSISEGRSLLTPVSEHICVAVILDLREMHSRTLRVVIPTAAFS